MFKNAATLSTELCEAKDNYRLGKLERTLAKADLLILDELSYLSFNRHQSELLFKVISDRSEKSSTIVTTNLPFSKWTDLFENTTMVAALIDRLSLLSVLGCNIYDEHETEHHHESAHDSSDEDQTQEMSM